MSGLGGCGHERTDAADRLVDAFLDHGHGTIDAELPAVLRLMTDRRAARSWHKHGSFKDHLYGCFRILSLWQQSREVRYCGLLHSVYSNEYVDLALFDPLEGRAVLRACVGEAVESMVHRFCTMPRNAFVTALLHCERTPVDGLRLDDGRGGRVSLDRAEVGAYLVITVADFVEQWYSWQEDTMSGYPDTAQVDTVQGWSAALWPGPLRPGASGLSLASRLALHLPALGVPVPPVFGHCTRTLSADDEAAASALYWEAATLSAPRIAAAATEALLRESVRLNPWVAEPRLVLAQLALMAGRFDEAGDHARSAYQLLRAWGVQWDKRVSWEGWVIWSRLLAQGARERRWPKTLSQHNQLGLVRS